MYHTGLRMAIPRGYVGLLVPRSSYGIRGYALLNTVGVIDSDYRGEVMVAFNKEYDYEGKAAVQMLIVPVLQLNIVVDNYLDTTTRGEGGFGSTNKGRDL
jgi:dUTP pyrophosphatase